MIILSKIIGIIAFILMICGLIPLLGWVNYIVIPIAIIGFFFGIFSKNNGGMVLNGIILIVAIIRLMIGGGIL